jgi:hypothetical protein
MPVICADDWTRRFQIRRDAVERAGDHVDYMNSG